ncbi:MAG: hypothetical protein ABWX94_01920 [Candidatus Saccharimonadales bacterium]
MDDSRTLFEKYSTELKALPNVTGSQSKDEDGLVWTFTSTTPNSLKVELKWWQKDADFILLDVEGVDCGYWHTAEEETLDYHIELAKAALLGDIAYNRSTIFRLKEVCFKVGDTWECTLTDNNVGTYHYIKTRKTLRLKTDSLE